MSKYFWVLVAFALGVWLVIDRIHTSKVLDRAILVTREASAILKDESETIREQRAEIDSLRKCLRECQLAWMPDSAFYKAGCQ